MAWRQVRLRAVTTKWARRGPADRACAGARALPRARGLCLQVHARTRAVRQGGFTKRWLCGGWEGRRRRAYVTLGAESARECSERGRRRAASATGGRASAVMARSTRVYVGNLTSRVRESDLEYEFGR